MDSKHSRRSHGGVANALKKVIQAAVDAADGDRDVPPELQLYWTCQRFGGLPDAGPILEQDAGLLSRMSLLSAAYDAVQHMRGLKGDEIHKMNPAHGRTIAWLDEIGIRV